MAKLYDNSVHKKNPTTDPLPARYATSSEEQTTATAPSNDVPMDRDCLFAYLEDEKASPMVESGSESDWNNGSTILTLSQALDHPVSEDILDPSYAQGSCSLANACPPPANSQDELVAISYQHIRNQPKPQEAIDNLRFSMALEPSQASASSTDGFVAQPLNAFASAESDNLSISFSGQLPINNNSRMGFIPSSDFGSPMQQETHISEQNNYYHESDDEFSNSQLHKYDEEKWHDYLRQLLEFKAKYGHCCVPYKYKPNPALSRWVRRQRYQYKLKVEGKPGGITESRVEILEKAGFVWNAHGQKWQNRWNELRAYCLEHGNGNVPHNYRENPELANWVKNQRRQHKLFQEGKPSNITQERIDALNSLGFTWEH
eukprot:scaffold344_cov130-Cylindrotheca_fusiformis.AAC.3